jgi:ubiquinone/menaquinone biosynthesis C-methylase UbiE
MSNNTTVSAWPSRWDRQQEVYIPFREQRFDVIFDTLRMLVELEAFTEAPRVLDLACGPGAIGQRLLDRFASSSCVGVDIDPVLLHLARQVATPYGERFVVKKVDLSEFDWAQSFEGDSFDVITSSTALHWLSPRDLERVINECARILRPGGMFFNADNLAFNESHTRVQRISSAIDQHQQAFALPAGGESWKQWWDGARLDPELGPLCEERDLRFPTTDDRESAPPFLEMYKRLLVQAGFEEVTTIWQRFDDRVLMARLRSLSNK